MPLDGKRKEAPADDGPPGNNTESSARGAFKRQPLLLWLTGGLYPLGLLPLMTTLSLIMTLQFCKDLAGDFAMFMYC